MSGFVSMLTACSLTCLCAQPGSAVIIQALFDLDNDSEDLLSSLISKVDTIIDPKVVDSRNATQELALALLRLTPLIRAEGNISDTARGVSIRFSLKAEATTEAALGAVAREGELEEEEDDVLAMRGGGILQPVVQTLEPYLFGAANILFNGILSNIIANFMYEASLLSNTNPC